MEIPTDMIVVGGLTLSGLLSGLAKLLYQNGFFVKYKKFTGIGLVILGVAIAVTATYIHGTKDSYNLLLAVLTGISAGLGAVGIQSTAKNAVEGLQK